MIIQVSLEGAVELREPDDFKNFKIVTGASGSVLARALDGIAVIEPDGKTAWVSQQALKRWQGRDQPADWIASFDKMVASVKRFGWVRDEDGSVRAHIEGA
jgi:hypothetical protein